MAAMFHKPNAESTNRDPSGVYNNFAKKDETKP
jgi:hypothetical protein